MFKNTDAACACVYSSGGALVPTNVHVTLPWDHTVLCAPYSNVRNKELQLSKHT